MAIEEFKKDLEERLPEIIKESKNWVQSNEGEKRLVEALKQASLESDEFDKATYVDPETLKHRITY